MTSNHLLLYRLAELMLAKGRHVLAVDELFDDEKIGDFVKSIQIDSPYQQMLYEGVLTETVKDEQLTVSFTIEGYFHFILGEVIYDLSKGKNANFLLGLLNSSTLNGIKEGIEQCLIRDIIANQFERLISFIDSGGNNLEICIRPLLYFMKSYGVETTLNKLLENPTDNDWQILIKLNDLLDELQLQVLRKEFLNSVIKKISFTNKYDLQLGLHAIAVIDYEQARMHYERIDLTINFLQFDSDFLYSLGDCETRFGQYDKALEYYENSLYIALMTFGNEHSVIATSYNKIGNIWDDKGEYDKALEYYEKSLEIKLKTLGSEHPSVAGSYGNIGVVWDDKGEYDKALEYYEKSLDIELKAYGNEHPSVAMTYNNIGIVWDIKGDCDKALEYFEKSYDILLQTFGNEHLSVAELNSNIGIVWMNKLEYDKSLEFHEKSLVIRLKSLGNEHPSVAGSYGNIGIVWKNKGEYDRSLEYYEKSLSIRLKTFGNGHPLVAETYGNIGLVCKNKGEYGEALEYFEKSLAIELNALDNDHPSVAETYENIGLIWKQKGEYQKAMESHQKCLEIRIKKFGIEDSRTRKSIANVKQMYQKLGRENEIPGWMINE